jgi:putative transposase
MIGAAEEDAIRRSLKLTFEDLDVIPHAVGIMPDHVHVVVSAPPKVSPAELAKRMKGAAAHAVNERVDRRGHPPFAWQGEHGVLSCGEKALSTIVAYVDNQLAHHAADTLWPGLERIADAARPRPGIDPRADRTKPAQAGCPRDRTRSLPSRLQPTSVTEPGNSFPGDPGGSARIETPNVVNAANRVWAR